MVTFFLGFVILIIVGLLFFVAGFHNNFIRRKKSIFYIGGLVLFTVLVSLYLLWSQNSTAFCVELKEETESLKNQQPLDSIFFPTSTTGQLVKHTYYTLSYAEESEQAEWVFYRLTQNMLSVRRKRSENFRPDPFVSTGSADLSDYKNSGYDRGHLASAADMNIDETAMSESFYMSNISPQSPSFNRGIWKRLETRVRHWATAMGDIYVISGGILRPENKRIGHNGVEVPALFYKIVYSSEEKTMLGFVIPNEKSEKPLFAYVSTVDSIEMLTGIDFFYKMNTRQQELLESKTDTLKWAF